MELALPHRLAAQALARGEPLAALNAVAGDSQPHALALRGIALAQMGELESAQRELAAAAASFVDEPLFRARALAARAEVAAARRELGEALEALAAAADELEAAGDVRNASWSRLVRVRLLALVGDAEAARAELGRATPPAPTDRALVGAVALAQAAAASRDLSADEALDVLDDALGGLAPEDHPLLHAELLAHREALSRPLARVSVGGASAEATLVDLARVVRGRALPPGVGAAPHWFAVDAIAGRVLRPGEDAVDLSGRPVLFALLDALARTWPDAIGSAELIEGVFEGPGEDESHRDRLRVELARLRKLLPPGLELAALGNAWRLETPEETALVHVELLCAESALGLLLSDGAAWAARDLALALGASPRSVQRALAELARTGEALALGRARSRRWTTPAPDPTASGIATRMFLVGWLGAGEAPPPTPKGDSR